MEKKISYQVTKPIQDYVDLRLHNLRLIFDLIQQCSPISRMELAQKTGLSATSIVRICGNLSEAGLIRELPSPRVKKAGRRAVMLGVCEDAVCTLCISLDIGACQCAITNINNQTLASREFIYEGQASCEQLLTHMKRLMTCLCVEAKLSVDRIKGVGISVVGGVDGDVVLFSPQLNWSNVPIRSIAEEIFGLPATVENDCKASLIGECRAQYGRNPPLNISYLAFERTGVGSATIINGNLLRGSDNIAGEVGHITVDPNGMLCDCGRRGCLQTYLTEKFLVQRGMAISPEFNSIMAINDAYGKGDCRVCELFEQVQQQIAMAFNTLMCAYNPDFVIFNDAYYLNTYWKWMQEKSKESESFLFRPLVASLRILPAVLGDTACLYGISCITQDAALARHLEKSIEMMETPDERAEAETRREFQAGKRSVK